MLYIHAKLERLAQFSVRLLIAVMVTCWLSACCKAQVYNPDFYVVLCLYTQSRIVSLFKTGVPNKVP